MISADNVFYQPFRTTNGAIPFDRITTADYEPAIIEGLKRHSLGYMPSHLVDRFHLTFEGLKQVNVSVINLPVTIVVLHLTFEGLKRYLK